MSATAIDFSTFYGYGSPYHQARRGWTLTGLQTCISAAVELLGRPASVLDLGCAEGASVEWWREQHNVKAFGVDLAVRPGVPYLVRGDLRDPAFIVAGPDRVFEWVTCWEVAEHLPATAAETLCESIARHVAPKGLAIFTAAGPNQPGKGHIHCQPRRYWKAQIEACGLKYHEPFSLALRAHWTAAAPRSWWYGKNAMVFHRG